MLPKYPLDTLIARSRSITLLPNYLIRYATKRRPEIAKLPLRHIYACETNLIAVR